MDHITVTGDDGHLYECRLSEDGEWHMADGPVWEPLGRGGIGAALTELVRLRKRVAELERHLSEVVTPENADKLEWQHRGIPVMRCSPELPALIAHLNNAAAGYEARLAASEARVAELREAYTQTIDAIESLQARERALREALRIVLVEIAALCVTPSDPYKDGAFPQLENPADRRCLALAIDTCHAALAAPALAKEEPR